MTAIGSALGPVGLGIMAGSQILGGLSSYSEGKQQARAYEVNADMARKQAANQAAQEKAKYARLAAQQRASFGASGLDVNVGSPLDVLADSDAEGAVSAMQMLYSGELEAANWKQRAASARSGARGGLLSGLVGGLGTGLMGASELGYLDGGTAALKSTATTQAATQATRAGIDPWWATPHLTTVNEWWPK